jgi:hypothetical protein
MAPIAPDTRYHEANSTASADAGERKGANMSLLQSMNDLAQLQTWIDRVESLPLVVVVIAVGLALVILLKVVASALDILIKLILVAAIGITIIALVDPELFREVDARLREWMDGVRGES